jgi:hypothetical protein
VSVAAAIAAGFTHVVWVPDSHTGRWEPDLVAAGRPPLRPCREGEAVGLAAGLLLGGATPLVVIQCTGFFEAGDAVRNVAHDLKLPLKLLVGVRGAKGGGADNCPTFADPVARAWRLAVLTGDGPDAVRALAAEPGPAVLLWDE